MAILILLLTASFIAGSFPTSILTGKYLKNIDIRSMGVEMREQQMPFVS